MLELKNISYKINDKVILNDINLTINERDFIVITGPNGSGKSTLLKIIMGLVKPTSGKVILDGCDITDKLIYERANMGITFTFQTPVNFKGLTVRDLLCISRSYYYDDYVGRELLKKVGLCAQEYLNREVNNNLSGGELKRIEIATALAKQGKYLLFDEPEAGIDLWSFDSLTKLFLKLKNCCNIIVSHQRKILEMADCIILLKDGIVEKIGTFDELEPSLQQPTCARLAR